MVRVSSQERVRLAPADWGGLCTVALTILAMVAATFYQVHDLAAANRVKQARFEIELTHLKNDVKVLQADVRLLVMETRQ
ncbi:hypothetical protein Mal64_14070 [Pseudobythopirellula maris]|uniref:Uncharacterized protein n=1 Tax=Pseudobythopirellula maris TaxID=2527991 RepID=A0A5C5ZVD3_9BACT|nr:hypothetical protein [Pseudobythopirellula maris]TWT91008.1 hypothetical protein Mal64_14070 [Pseudobythopirellula maris]